MSPVFTCWTDDATAGSCQHPSVKKTFLSLMNCFCLWHYFLLSNLKRDYFYFSINNIYAGLLHPAEWFLIFPSTESTFGKTKKQKKKAMWTDVCFEWNDELPTVHINLCLVQMFLGLFFSMCEMRIQHHFLH